MTQSSNPLPDSAELPPQARGRWVLGLIFALFLAPIVAALFLNSRLSDWQPSATKNYGELIMPVVPLGEVFNALDDQRPADADELPPWRLIWPRAGTCDASCQAQVDVLTRIKQTLGRHQDKLQILVTDVQAAGGGVDAALSQTLHTAFRTRELSADGLYLVDPLGNAMMYYPPEPDATGLRKDLDRLIRHSKFRS
ncbi:MAG: hypothetical protein AAF358_07980 [Pseudomonadota bacterium]